MRDNQGKHWRQNHSARLFSMYNRPMTAADLPSLRQAAHRVLTLPEPARAVIRVIKT
jgi:hypothetical protein